MKIFLSFSCLFISCFAFIVFIMSPSFTHAQVETELDDPFYGQKGTDAIIGAYSSAPFLDVVETVDPFSGNLNLLHTDTLLPGNGGLDINVQRAYNSRVKAYGNHVGENDSHMGFG